MAFVCTRLLHTRHRTPRVQTKFKILKMMKVDIFFVESMSKEGMKGEYLSDDVKYVIRYK